MHAVSPTALAMRNSLEHYLETADGAGSLMAHARLLIRLKRIYREIAPQYLFQASALANYKKNQNGIVIIHAHSGAIAVKLRQIAPRLTEGFCKKGFECSGIQVKVQVPERERQSMTSTQKPLSPGTCRELAGLCGSLPDSPLRGALEQLLARAARR